MADIYIYADETGTLDFDGASKPGGGSPYFGFGTAVFDAQHGEHLWSGMQLRARLETQGLRVQRGFHARDDTNHTRSEMLTEVAGQAPRVDATLLLKERAYANVRAAGEMRLYKMAWFLHFKFLAPQISHQGDHLFVVVATLSTKARQTLATAALDDVCAQLDRKFTLCIWDSGTSWGLQVADYALWTIQRRAHQGSGTWWDQYVKSLTKSVYFPWGEKRIMNWR